MHKKPKKSQKPIEFQDLFRFSRFSGGSFYAPGHTVSVAPSFADSPIKSRQNSLSMDNSYRQGWCDMEVYCKNAKTSTLKTPPAPDYRSPKRSASTLKVPPETGKTEKLLRSDSKLSVTQSRSVNLGVKSPQKSQKSEKESHKKLEKSQKSASKVRSISQRSPKSLKSQSPAIVVFSDENLAQNAQLLKFDGNAKSVRKFSDVQFSDSNLLTPVQEKSAEQSPVECTKSLGNLF